MKPLNLRQRRFVEEYLLDANGAAAARRAGYATRSAAMTAWELRQRPDVIAEIERRRAERSVATEITAERALRELARISFVDPRRLLAADGSVIPLKDLDEDVAAAVASIEMMEKPARGGEGPPVRTYKIRLLDKRMALANLGKHLAMFEKSPPAAEPAQTDGVLDEAGLATAARIASFLEAARRQRER